MGRGVYDSGEVHDEYLVVGNATLLRSLLCGI